VTLCVCVVPLTAPSSCRCSVWACHPVWVWVSSVVCVCVPPRAVMSPSCLRDAVVRGRLGVGGWPHTCGGSALGRSFLFVGGARAAGCCCWIPPTPGGGSGTTLLLGGGLSGLCWVCRMWKGLACEDMHACWHPGWSTLPAVVGREVFLSCAAGWRCCMVVPARQQWLRQRCQTAAAVALCTGAVLAAGPAVAAPVAAGSVRAGAVGPW
jgi:hypothetical protein